MRSLRLPVLLGTNRKERKSVLAAKWLVSEMQKRDELETRVFDVADFELPQRDYGQAIKEAFPEWRDAIVKADGLVIVSPEYNHGYPGPLKAVLDLLLREYVHKAVAFVGVSAGPWGGTRVIEACGQMGPGAGPARTLYDLYFSKGASQFYEDGEPLAPIYEPRAKEFFGEPILM